MGTGRRKEGTRVNSKEVKGRSGNRGKVLRISPTVMGGGCSYAGKYLTKGLQGEKCVYTQYMDIYIYI